MCVQRTLRRVRERFHRFIPNGALISRRLFAFVNVCSFNHLQF